MEENIGMQYQKERKQKFKQTMTYMKDTESIFTQEAMALQRGPT